MGYKKYPDADYTANPGSDYTAYPGADYTAHPGTDYASHPASFTPASLPNLALWLDGGDASTITLNGSNVSAWADKSGLANHADQGTPSLQPAYSSAGLNGRPMLQFDVTDDVMTNTTLSMGAGSAFTIAIVGKSTTYDPDVDARNGSYFKLGNPTVRHTAQAVIVGGTRYVMTTNTNVTISGTFGIGKVPAYLIWGEDGTPGSAVLTFRANGAAKTASAGHDDTNAISGYALVGTNGGTSLGPGISEVAVYSRLLSAAEIAQLEAYFVTKWGF